MLTLRSPKELRADDEHLANAVAALGDKLAAELRECEEVLKTEADVAKRRAAGNRYLELTSRRAA